jgi:hypothetical protein
MEKHSSKRLPPVTRLSERRIGYRVIDVIAWLDGRRQKMIA